MSERTNEEINLAVAEALEPTRVTATGGYPQCWVSSKDGWQPRDFCTDPAAILMLMEKQGISVQVEHSPRPDEKKFCAYKLDTDISVTGDELGVVVCEAFLAAQGRG